MIHSKIYLLFASIFLNLLIGFSQNLVKNSGFEEFYFIPATPFSIGELHELVAWSSPNSATSDYFNINYTSKKKDGSNYCGKQIPLNGGAYCGIIMYSNDEDEYREYLQGELFDNLEKGEKYKISFYVSLAECSDYSLNKIGIRFSNEKLDFIGNKLIEIDTSIIIFGDKSALKDREKWMKLEADFIANGDEKYFIVGNFYPDKSKKIDYSLCTKTVDIKLSVAYYYFDDFVIKKSGSNNSENQFSEYYWHLDSAKKMLVIRDVFYIEKEGIFHTDLYSIINKIIGYTNIIELTVEYKTFTYYSYEKRQISKRIKRLTKVTKQHLGKNLKIDTKIVLVDGSSDFENHKFVFQW